MRGAQGACPDRALPAHSHVEPTRLVDCAPMTSQPSPKPAVLDRERDLYCKLLDPIPLARAMQLSVHSFDGSRLRLSAPLAANVNDKGCAFGGSLASAMTLAGWGLIVLRLAAADVDYDVFVQDSKIRYLAPVWSDFAVEATLAAKDDFDIFLATLANRGRARLSVHAHVALSDGSNAAQLQARFVASRRAVRAAATAEMRHNR
jgi:thioesterase domain-containing protein